jgi:hypothetical protein
LNHFILPSFRLQPQRIGERAHAVPQQFEFVFPIQLVQFENFEKAAAFFAQAELDRRPK